MENSIYELYRKFKRKRIRKRDDRVLNNRTNIDQVIGASTLIEDSRHFAVDLSRNPK